MDMHDDDQSQDRSESNPSPQDLAGMMDLELNADDPVFHQSTKHNVSGNLESDFTDRDFDQEETRFQYDDDVIDVEATSPEEDPFAEEFNPEKHRTLVGLQNSGFAKTAVVVGGSLAILTGGAIIFQNQIPKSQVAKEIKKKDPAAEKLSLAQAAADKAQQSESEAKAQLALAKQKDSLAQANNANGTHSPTTANSTAGKPTTTGVKPNKTNPSQNPPAAVTVNQPTTATNQNIPTAQLVAKGRTAANNNRNLGTTARQNSKPIGQNAALAKAPIKPQPAQVAQANTMPLAQSAGRILPIVRPGANKEPIAQARPTKAAAATQVAAQRLTPVAAPGVPVAKAKPQTANSRDVQVAKAALREPPSDNYRFGTTASVGNNQGSAQDTRRPLTDVMRSNGNNLNRDTQLAIVRSPGLQGNAAGNRSMNGNDNVATGNISTGGVAVNRPLDINNGTLANAQATANNAPASTATPSLTNFLQRSNQTASAPATIAPANPSTVAVATSSQLQSPVAPVPRTNSNPMDSTPSTAAAQSTDIPTSVAALGNVGDKLSKKLTAIVAPLNLAWSSTAKTSTTATAASATIATDISASNLGQGIQKYQRLQPIGQVASADTDNSNSKALLSSRPAFAYTQSVVTTGGIDSRGLVAARTSLPVDNNIQPTNNAIAKSILVGTSAKASTVTPILWNAGGNSGAKFIIKLDEPILDNAGQVALPAGTQLVAIAKPSKVSAEMADLEVVGVVVQGEEFAPPAGMLTIRNDQNGLVVGQDYFQRGNQIAGRDSMIFVTGALGTVGRVLNQPTSTFTSTGTNGTVTSSSNGQPNILGAVLEGGFKDLPATWTQRNQQAIQAIASQPNVYQLPKGSSVRVFVNQTLNF